MTTAADFKQLCLGFAMKWLMMIFIFAKLNNVYGSMLKAEKVGQILRNHAFRKFPKYWESKIKCAKSGERIVLKIEKVWKKYEKSM